jgi:hypothetical protein
MRVSFLYRLKKYGTWIEGTYEVVDENSNIKDSIIEYLKELNPNCNRIEVTSILKIK